LAEARLAATLAHLPARLAELDEIAAAYAKSGLRAAELTAAQLKEKAYCGNVDNRAEQKPGCYTAYEVAIQYGLLGDKEKALRWLTRALHDGPTWNFTPSTQPELDCLRSDPRFQDLLRRLGLPP
jgi:hypothetical protein